MNPLYSIYEYMNPLSAVCIYIHTFICLRKIPIFSENVLKIHILQDDHICIYDIW